MCAQSPSGIVTVTNWSQSPGGTLYPGSNTVTLTPCPVGINGWDTSDLYLWVSGGDGSPEAVQVTGGRCTSGASSGTITFNAANPHSGAWTLSSASGGIYEAIEGNLGRQIYAPAGDYVMHACLSINLHDHPLLLFGDGFDSAENHYLFPSDVPAGGGTDLDFSGLNCGNAMTIYGEGHTRVDGNANPVTLRSLGLRGAFNGTGGNGLFLPDYNLSARVTLDAIQIAGFGGNGLYSYEAYELHVINGTFIGQNGQWGIYLDGVVNISTIRDCYINDNGAAGNYGNMKVVGTDAPHVNWSVSLLIENTDFEQAGQYPFPGANPTDETGLYVDGVKGVMLLNDYFESNLGYQHAITYGPGVKSLTEIGNYVVDGMITYNADMLNVVSYNMTFDHGRTSAGRIIPPGTNIALWRLGPDYVTDLAAGTQVGGTGFKGDPANGGKTGFLGSAPRGTSPSQWTIFNGPINKSITHNLTCGLANTCPDGLYRLTVYMYTTTTGDAGTVTLNLTWTDGESWAPGVQRSIGSPLILDLNTNNYKTASYVVYLDGQHDPILTFTEAGETGSPTWDYAVSFEKLF